MADVKRALSHLEDAETAIMSHFMAFSNAADVEIDEDRPDMALVTMDLPDPLPVLLAVMRSVARAAGALEGDQVESTYYQCCEGGANPAHHDQHEKPT